MTRTKTPATRFDPYQVVTDQIIARLEAGTAPWRKPWDAEHGLPRSLSTGKPYRGINPFLLGMSALEQGFSSPWWGTYNQISERGGQVRKGEHGTLIVFWKSFIPRDPDPVTGEPQPRRFMLRTYKVFNADQADDLRLPATKPRQGEDLEPIAQCRAVVDQYLANGGPTVSFGSSRAAYTPALDHLQMPDLTTFVSAEEFYSTYFHECTHSTGHTTRLNREGTDHPHFGDAAYSKEELVAEMGSAMLAGHTGIVAATIDNSAAYLASWIKALKGDPKLVVHAAAQAQRSTDLILGTTFDADAADTADAAEAS